MSMAVTNKFQNILSLFSNPKTRTILVMSMGVLLLGMIIALIGLHERSSANKMGAPGEALSFPSIESIPGTAQESPTYRHAQEEQNKRQAEAAEKTGGSAVATFTNSLQAVPPMGSSSEQAQGQGGQEQAGQGQGGQEQAGQGQAGQGQAGQGQAGQGQAGQGQAGQGQGGQGQVGQGQAGQGQGGQAQAGQSQAGQEGNVGNLPGIESPGMGGGVVQGQRQGGKPPSKPSNLASSAAAAQTGQASVGTAQGAAAPLTPAELLARDNSPTARQFKQFQQQLASQQLQATEQLASQNIQNVGQNTKATAQAMGNQAKALLQDWSVPTQQYVAGQASSATANAALGEGVSSSQGGSATQSAPAPTTPPIIKAGTIAYAVLDTAVNTDEPGPVLATIEEGHYQGTKLIGTLQPVSSQFAQKVVLSFTTMSSPKWPSSLQVNAVAVDPNTSRTALATSVDNHYIERWGSLLASSFLEGYGSAIASSGSVQYYYPSTGGGVSGFSVVNSKNTGEEIAMAFGQVGQTMGEQLGNYFNRPPTIKVAAGSAIGILFMSDVANPAAQQG